MSSEFKTNIKEWLLYDEKLEKATKAIKSVKEKKTGLGEKIASFMSSNGLKNNRIKINNSHLKVVSRTKKTPFNKQYVFDKLKEKYDPDKANEIATVLFNLELRSRMCLEKMIGEEADEIWDFLQQNRSKEVIENITRVKIREAVTISDDDHS